MSIQPFSRTNRAVQSLPKHLLQFAVDQRYEEYTPVDHAVWRFIMRQNIFFLKEYAHKVYFQGLLDTGISFERIPRIEEMNDILAPIDSAENIIHLLDPRNALKGNAGVEQSLKINFVSVFLQEKNILAHDEPPDRVIDRSIFFVTL